ncbi:thermonuclease family protein [Rhizobium sp. P32RR-XVIII]|uniref:thermonuclease family protein n=1 Tax=Rhizobium sp. P32RR-XVIII TaxID=2726738 RepID=UPI001456F6C6|nr:thermonuclease family protein [Rhizobium sp. P32RR-XVIII]
MRDGTVALLIMLCVGTALAAPAREIELHPGVTLVTGDTWIDGKSRYRLFGVQSCLRGTYFTNAAGRRLDCGDASMAFLAAFIQDTGPRCAPVATTPELFYVVCSAAVGDQRVDLGTALISRGYAFAALGQNGLPANPAYAVAEHQARESKSGLWRFADVQHPSLALGRAATRARGP